MSGDNVAHRKQSMNQNYGVLRVVRVRVPADATTDLQEKYPAGWLPEEQLVHLLTRRETTIGRALTNDIMLMDPTVSREHARLTLDEYGWHVCNLTGENIVRVNGRAVPGGGSQRMRPQDVLVLGSTMLQLIAPQSRMLNDAPEELTEPLSALHDDASLKKQLKPSNGSSILPVQQPFPVQDQSWRETPPVVPLASPFASSLALQPEPDMQAQPWDDEDERGIGTGITMQFALPQRLGARTRWLIAGVGVAILIVSAVITIILNSLVGLSALAQNGPSSVIAALTIPIIPALGITLLVNFIDRFEREPWFLRLAAFLWGAIIAIPPTSFIELNVDTLIQHVLGANTSIMVRTFLQGVNAGITEETVKGLGLLLLFFVLRDEFDNVTDGLVYSALIGAGFAMAENFVYFAQYARDSLLVLFIGRIMLGWLCHSTFIACFGVALGYTRHTRVRWKQIVVPLVGYLCAVGLHSIFDFINFYASATVLAAPSNAGVQLFSLLAIIGDYIPPFIAQIMLLYFLIKSLAHEAAVIREFLASEVSSGVVRVDEYALLQNSFQRTKRERRILKRYGIKQWIRAKELYQTEIGLAFRKWHVSMGDKPKLGYRQPEDAYRQRIKRLRQEIAVAEAQKK